MTDGQFSVLFQVIFQVCINLRPVRGGVGGMRGESGGWKECEEGGG